MMANRLCNEKSPYLLQHKDNPVDWYPWCEEAFQRARKEDKPIFLSIGYSTCHWCHVMAHQSFEDEEVAALLNRGYISIKVDREERPDIDAVYMAACQAVTGNGGWPLTVIMTPEQKPFFVGTYLPKRQAFGHPGLLQVLEEVLELWRERREELIKSGEAVTAAVRGMGRAGQEAPERGLFHQAYQTFLQQFDPVWGGFGRAPRFPSPHNLLFLMRYAKEEHVPMGLFMAERTLEDMARGGIFDQIGGGFSRYSTDEKWLVPHFEKMLYDNALLILAYLEAYRITGKETYADIVRRTADYILRELTDEQGGFYCGQDADSDGVEGKYYLLTPEEVEAVLGPEEGKAFCSRYGITPGGVLEGKSIPHRIGRDGEGQWAVAGRMDLGQPAHSQMDPGQVGHGQMDPGQTGHGQTGHGQEEGWCQKLYRYRKERTDLHRDDKILLAWNAWTMIALARAGRLLKEDCYLEAAQKAEHFVENCMNGEEDRLYHRYREGELGCKGQLEDQAVYVLAQLELYRATFRTDYLEKALARARQMVELFEDPVEGGYFMSAADAGELITRPKELYDGAMPSGNSVAAMALQRLAALTGEPRWQEAAERQLAYCAYGAKDYPSGSSYALSAMAEALYPHRELVCAVGGRHKDLPEGLREKLRSLPSYGLEILVKTWETEDALARCAPFTKDYPLPEEGEVYYLCVDGACRAPVREWEAVERLLADA